MSFVNYRNTFVWGYNDIPFSFRKKDSDKFFVRYGRLTREPLPWREECIATAKLIYDEANGEIPTIYFSGGMDSQIVAESFRLSGVPFKIVIIRLTDSWNWHDMKFAVEWCEEYNIEPLILDLDYRKFLENEAWDIGSLIQSWTPQFCILPWAMELVDGFPVIGYGEADLHRNKKIATKSWNIDTEILRCQERYLRHKNRNGAGSFFKYTPELKISQFLDWETIKFANNIEHTDVAMQYNKNEMCIPHFPNLKPRPKIVSWCRKGRPYTDYTGFEYIPKPEMQLEHELRTEFQSHWGNVQELWTDYDEQVKTLTIGYEHLYENFQNKRID